MLPFLKSEEIWRSCRAGEYEGLIKKLADPQWKPDFGPAVFNKRSGATAVGARDFLVAYNINLNTTSTRRANAIAYDVREKGRPKREDDTLTGKIIYDENGEKVMIPGSLKIGESDWLVYRGIWNCTDLNEPYRYFCHSAAHCI